MFLTVDQAKDYLKKMGECLYWDEDANTFNEDWLQEDLDESCADILSCIECRYGTEITDTKALALLRGVQQKLLKYLAWNRENVSNIPEDVIQARNWAVSLLNKICSGEKCLPGQDVIQEEKHKYSACTNRSKFRIDRARSLYTTCGSRTCEEEDEA